MSVPGTGRAVPFYCPYCGEETLRPFGEDPGAGGTWRCDDCTRVFRLSFTGLAPDSTATVG